MSTRITAHSVAVTWGWSRWFVYAGLIALAVWFGAQLHDGTTIGHASAIAAGLLLVAGAAFAFPRCPRCSHHLFGRNEDGSRRFLRPRSRCGKCNLDLTRYSVADPRARKE